MHNLFAYIIYSKEIDQYYVGHTGNLDDRIIRHPIQAVRQLRKLMIG